MSELRKANCDGLYFVTLSVVGWIDVFSRRQYADLIINNLDFCCREKGLELYAFVIMTNHLHLLAAQEEGQLGDVLTRFKSFTAKEILKAIELNTAESRKDWLLYMFRFHAKFKKNYDQYHFWQYTNHPTYIYDHSMLMQKINYIHDNPVRAGYVTEQCHWYYSSAHPRAPLKTLAW